MKYYKKIVSFCLIFIMCFSIISFSNIKQVSAAMSVSQVTNDTNIDSKYSFSPRFINGVSYLEGFGGYSYTEDLWKSIRKNSNGKYEIGDYSSNTYYPIRLNNSNKGKIGVWYRNIGEYNGKMLDLKITVLDWSEIRNPWTVDSVRGTLTGYPAIMFHKHDIEINPTSFAIKNTKYKFELYDKSGNLEKVNMHWNVYDLDDAQYIQTDDLYHSYLSQDTWLSVSGNKIYAPYNQDSTPYETKAMTTVLIDNKSSFIFGFSAQQYDNNDFTSTKRTKTWHTIQMSGETLAPFTTSVPTKSATSVVHKGDNITYTIKFTVPQQPSNYLYTKFQIKDVLPKGVKYKSFSVTNDKGSNVTNIFSGNISGQTFTASVSSPKSANFYYKTYTMTINCIADSSYDFSVGNNGSKTLVSNTATITSKAGTRAEESKNSNTVSTEIRYKITTSTDGNGTITNSLDSIVGGSDKTISYTPKAGYEVDIITVDNIKVDNSTYKDSYLFKDVYDNHKIHVTFTPTTDNKITVTKKVHKKDYNLAYGNLVAIFKCNGTDLNGSTHEYYEIVNLTKDDLNGDYYTKSVTFDNLIAGNYKVTEVDISRYDLTKVVASSGTTSSNNILNCDLVNNKEAKGTFTNSLTKFNLWSHSNIKINQFK